MRTISEINELRKQIDDLIHTEFIPALTNSKFLSVDEQKLFSLPKQVANKDITILSEMSNSEYQNSGKLTKSLCDNIINQLMNYTSDSEKAQIKQQIGSNKVKVNNETLKSLRCQ